MNVLIPENCLMWTSKGFCFPKDLTYGTEIFTIDPQNKLVTTPIIDDISEHSSIRVNTIFTKNNIATFIPNYRILSDGKFVSGSEITNKDSLHYTDSKIVEGFKEFQEKNVIEYSERAPFSAIVASYLAACGVKDSKGAVYFELVDEDSSKKFAKQLQENLLPELGGDVSITKGVVSQSKFGEKGISHLVLYRSEKFYNLRTSIDFTEDKILNSIYQNGLFIYFRFLNSLLSKGHPYHLNWFVRGLSEKYVILYLPWKSKIRKLLQNSCHLWNTLELTSYQNKSQRNLDELKLEKKEQTHLSQPILEIKEHVINCYQVSIPLGNMLVLDNLVIKPFELTNEEIEELKKFEDKSNLDLKKIRKKIMGSISSDKLRVKNINEIKHYDKEFHLHVLGIVKNKSKVMNANTRFGPTKSVNAVLYDETAEIKLKIWGDIASEINDGDALELFSARIQNGILYNTSNGWEKVHKIGEYD